MQKGIRTSIGLVLLVVVFGSGWIIYIWNKMQGKDLSTPPVVTYSEDEQYFEAFKILEEKEEEKQKESDDKKNSAKETSQAEQVAIGFQLLDDNIYLKNSFRVETAAETENIIREFLIDFPEIKELPIENLEAPKVFLIELPVLNRERIMTSLTRNKEVMALKSKEAPIWELELKTAKYEKEVLEFLKNFKDVKLVTVFPTNLEYIAKINIAGEKEKLADTLANLEKNYADVVTVK